MRCLLSLFAALLFACLCHASPPQAPPACVCTALARPPQAPPVKYVCQCEEPDDAKCKCHGSCGCYGAVCQLSQEAQWRSEGWRKDAYGNWYRILSVSENRYEVPMLYFQPMMYSGGGGGGC